MSCFVSLIYSSGLRLITLTFMIELDFFTNSAIYFHSALYKNILNIYYENTHGHINKINKYNKKRRGGGGGEVCQTDVCADW